MIGIFGNTNNYPYVLATGFRQLGIPVRLVVNRPEALHRPEAKVPQFKSGYPDWILDCANLNEDHFISESSPVGEVLNFLSDGCKAIFLNQIGPSLARDLGTRTVAFLTGSDIYYYGKYESVDTRSATWDPGFKASPAGRLAERKWVEFVTRQRNGIRAAEAVIFAPRGLVPEGDAVLDSIGVPENRRFFIYIADTLALKPAPTINNRSKLVIFNGTRLNWKQLPSPVFASMDDKGTGILLNGFAAYKHQGGKAELRLVRKGLHIDETEQLIFHLGIQNDVAWLDEMSLEKYYEQVRDADIVCDQFGSSFPGMAALDAMALGRPVLANFRWDLLGAAYPVKPPVCDAATPEEVCAHLDSLSTSRERRLELGRDARAFAEKYLSPEVNARKCIERLGLSV